MNYLGISAGFHDAALSVVSENGEILFAGHSERYNKQKHSKDICHDLINDALNYAERETLDIHYYENPWLKYARQWWTGEKPSWSSLNAKNIIGADNMMILGSQRKINTHSHHLSHAAAGFQTSPFNDATIVIIDAIGEFDTITIWGAWYDDMGNAQYSRLWSKSYPNSIGLLYSAITKRVGLKPLDEEYILMGMAAYGKPIHTDYMQKEFLIDIQNLSFKQNLHLGVNENDFLPNAFEMDIAASAQEITETLIKNVMLKARNFNFSDNLVYGGGVALNCLANRFLGDYFSKIWILPNPGDAGSSLGAAALGYGKKLNWKNAYLGFNIDGNYPIFNLLLELQSNKIVGVASGRAEFGPRALGNRSLLADPRGPNIKEQVNHIKRRQQFRPFAPVILEEFVNVYFDMPRNWNESRYMQVIAGCKQPNEYPAIVHKDGTSRVQTVPDDDSGIRHLLEEWYKITGCPMLLNTSLNIRGEPMVNDLNDAVRFEKLYGVKVCS
jgi:carbamoyltransferase